MSLTQTHVSPLLVAYDISDNRKRRNLFNHLRGYGTPLQESLFYCELSASKRQQLNRELKKLPLDGDDRLHCFLVNPELTATLSPSPLNTLQWVAE